MSRVLLITKGTYGDIVPFVVLGSALKARGHDVILISQCHYAPMAKRAGLEFDSWDTEEQYAAFVADFDLLQTPAGMRRFAHSHEFPQLQAEYRTIERQIRPADTVMLARHIGSLAAQFVSERTNTPLGSVFIAVSQAECFPVFVAFQQQILGEEINERRRAFGLPNVTNWEVWSKLPRRFFGCWPAWFASPSPVWPDRFTNVGFGHDECVETGALPPDLLDFIRENPVLISAGTGLSQHSRKFYAAAADACRLSGTAAILVCRHEQLVPHQIGGSIRWFKELPFASLMPHVPVVIHHGGTGTFVRAMRGGVPQVILAWGADRPDNARRLEELRLAAHLPPPRWRPEEIAAAMAKLQSSREVAVACRQAREAVMSNDLAEACKAVESM